MHEENVRLQVPKHRFILTSMHVFVHVLPTLSTKLVCIGGVFFLFLLFPDDIILFHIFPFVGLFFYNQSNTLLKKVYLISPF